MEPMADEAEPQRRWTRAYFWIPAAMVVAFAALTFVFANACLDRDDQAGVRRVAARADRTLATPLGPLTGAIARNWQSCCAANAWSIASVTGPILAAGRRAAVPVARARSLVGSGPPGDLEPGWFVWLASGIVALGHSLE
jgi:hypothetical protein